MGTYVIGDIHGCYDEWIELKNKIESQDKKAKFILVGDIIDRGEQSYEMIKWAMNNINISDKYRMVIGNHEEMKRDIWERYCRLLLMNKEEANGIINGFDHYGFFELLKNKGLDFEDIDYIITWIMDLPLYIEEEICTSEGNKNYIVAHSSIPWISQDMFKDKRLDINKIREEYGYNSFRQCVLYDRNYFGNGWEDDVTLVHGHTPTIHRSLIVRGAKRGRIDYRNKDINVDCGIVFKDYYSNLAAIRLEDMKEFYLKELREEE